MRMVLQRWQTSIDFCVMSWWNKEAVVHKLRTGTHPARANNFITRGPSGDQPLKLGSVEVRTMCDL